mgnify:CR=1 FL=1
MSKTTLEYFDEFHNAKRNLWKRHPCPKCNTEVNRENAWRNFKLLILPGKYFDGEKATLCDKCHGFGFSVDWEKEIESGTESA